MVQLPTVTREQLRQARNQSQGNAPFDIPFAKAALAESVARNVLTAQVTGRDPNSFADAATQSFQRTGGGPEIRQFLEQRAPVNADTAIAGQIAATTETLQRAASEARQEISFGDQVGAAWDLYTGTDAVMEIIKDWDNEFEVDPDFDYMANRETYEEGLSFGAIQYIRENARSAQHAEYLRRGQLEQERLEATLSAHGTGSALLAGVVGGVADPVGWLAGFGVLKGAQLVGVGSRAAFIAGNTARGVGGAALEGAVGNVAIDAMTAAAGRRVDASDYVISAGFGAAFGMALSPLTARSVRRSGAENAIREMQQRAAETEARLYETATANLGPEAINPEAISREVSRLYAEEGKRLAEIRQARPDQGDVWLNTGDVLREFRDSPATAPDAALRAAEDQVAEAIDSARLRLEEDRQAVSAAIARDDDDALVRAQEDLAESEALYRRAIAENRDEAPLEEAPTRPEITDYDREIGVDGMMQTDPVRAKMIAELYASADDWVARNPIDEKRLEDLISRMGRLTPALASTGQQLLRSNHPVARKIVGTLLESTTGASGRRRSAAIDKHMMERIYTGELEQLPHLMKLYRNRQGTGAVTEFFSRKQTRQFNRDLTEYRDAILNDRELPEVRPEIRAASAMLDRFYDRPRRDMISAGTPGHEALPASSTGYFTRRLRPDAIQNLTNAQRRALQAEYKRQLNLLWDDPVFADQIAARIIEHARIAATGGKEIPANLYSGAAAPLLRNALANANRGKLKLEEPEIEAMIKRITTKGPSFTKSRLDLDLSAEIRDPESGASFRLMDFYEQDQLKLALNYARRSSGEVALAKYGIMGEEGLTVLRESLSVGRDRQRLSDEALNDATDAFDQIAAEFLGRPFGKQGKLFRVVDNLRLLTASSRLGGMAFTQFGESANAIPALGVHHALQAVKDMPRLINDVRLGRESKLLSSIERVGGEFGTDYKVNFPFQNLDDTFVHGVERMGQFTKIVRATSNAVPFLNGWHYIHAAQVRGMAEQILHKTVKHVKNGSDDLGMLADMGFTPQIIDDLRANINKVAKFDKKGNLVEFDIQQMGDAALAADFAQAINRGAKQIIQGTFIGETGKWAHNDFLRLLTQFRTFSLVSVEKQWARVAALKGGIKTFGFLMGAMSFAIPIHLARIQLASIGREDRKEYLETQMELLNFGRSVLNYASLSGMASDMLDVGAATVNAFSGLTGIESPIDTTGVRGISDGDLGAVIPGLGYLNSTLRGLTSGDPEALLRSLPGGNLPYVVPMLNALNRDSEDWDLRER